MNRFLVFVFFNFLAVTIQAQDPNFESHPLIKFLRKNGITTSNVVMVKPELKKEYLKEFKKLPYIETYDSPGVQIQYPTPEGKLIKSFFEPDRSAVPMTAEAVHGDGVVNILRRFFPCSSLDGSQITYELMTHPQNYYVLLFWKKDNNKNNIATLKRWDEYAKTNPKIKLILINLD